jgi:predicted house-cleaning noncanonical NTP pyrophosphatase (MazG superfamily)
MWFLDLLDDPGQIAVPWFQTGYALEQDATTKRPAHARQEVVCTIDDLEDIRQRNAQEGSAASFYLLLKPTADFVRDRGYLQAVTAFSLEYNLAVEISGSPLAHAFYELARHGVRVFASKPTLEVTASPPVRFNKLIRDRLPERIAGRGEAVAVYRAHEDERLLWLKSKLVEEAYEAQQAEDAESLLAELADLQEVSDALLSSIESTPEERARVQARKAAERGGFEDGLVLLSTSESGGAPSGGPQFSTRVPSRPAPVTGISDGFRIELVPTPGDALEHLVHVSGLELRVRYQGTAITVTRVKTDQLRLFDL